MVIQMDSIEKLASLRAQLQKQKQLIEKNQEGIDNTAYFRKSQTPEDLEALKLANRSIGYVPADQFFVPNYKDENIKSPMVGDTMENRMQLINKVGDGYRQFKGDSLTSPKDVMREAGFSEEEMKDNYSDVAKELGQIRMMRLKQLLGTNNE